MSTIPTRTHAQRVAEVEIITMSVQADIRRAFELRDQEIDALRLRVEREAAEVRRLTGERNDYRDTLRATRSHVHDLLDRAGVPRQMFGADANFEDRIGQLVKERDEARTALATARLDGARAMRDDIADRLADSDIAPFALVAEIRAIDPAAVVGSGS